MEQRGDFFEAKIYPFKNNEASSNKAHTAIHLFIRHFSSGTAEEWIKDYVAFMGVCMWHAENLFTFARVFLRGDALSKFNALCDDEGIPVNDIVKENNASFDIVIRKLSVLLMPHNSLSTQKRYMTYFCQKPSEMKFRTYLTRLCEMNDYLTHFPPNFCVSQKLTDQQIIEIVNFGMPTKWKLRFAAAFWTMSKENITLELLMDFGERQEILESFLGSNSGRKPIPHKVSSTYKK